MSDLIDRQAAIDAFMDALTDVGVLDAEDVNTVIQMLPSAQPDVIRCKDCKHRILNERYENRKGEWGFKYYCDLDTGDPYELGRIAENDNWFCADAERK